MTAARHAIFACLTLLALTRASVAREIDFPAPPRLATTAAELAAMRAAPDFQKQQEDLVKKAAPYLEQPPYVPAESGNWTFYYANPKTGGRLVPVSLTEHRDPATGEIFTDERIVAAYRTRLHDKANAAAVDIGWAFTVTGDDRYAKLVRDILVQLADAMPTFPDRLDRWGHRGIFAPWGGRRYSQSLDEAYGVIRLAKAYDLTRLSPAYSEADHRHIHDDFFRPTAATLLFSNKGRSNHQTWYNAGLLCIASVLGDEAMVNQVLDMQGGYYDQLARSVGDDGLWFEGTIAYHRYAFSAMQEIVEAGRRMGLPLHQAPRFRSMITGPLDATYPNGQFPAVNDSDRLSIGGFRSIFQWAAEVYDDERFRSAAADPLQAIATGSRTLNPTGLAFLHQGQGDQAVTAVIDYGPHGDGHGHFDKLNLMLYGLGRELLLDPGRLNYSHPAYKTWVKHTAAHNTVTVDQQSQRPTAGKLVQFDVSPDAVACTVQSDDAYRDVMLRRHLYLQGDLLVDVLTVEAPQPRQIDWFAHVDVPAIAHDQGEGTPATLPQGSGYEHFEAPRSYDLAASAAWDFVLPEAPTKAPPGERAAAPKRLRLWTLTTAPEQIVVTRGIGHLPTDHPPCLIRRRHTARTAFVTLYDLSGDGSLVTSATAAGDGSAVSITTPRGELHLAISKQAIQPRD